MRAIEVTPTWTGLLPWMLNVMVNEDPQNKGRISVEHELKRMAQAADKWNAYCRATNETPPEEYIPQLLEHYPSPKPDMSQLDHLEWAR